MLSITWVAVGVTFLVSVGILAWSWVDRRIDELGSDLRSEIRRLEAKSDAQAARIDRLSERVEAHQRAHA